MPCLCVVAVEAIAPPRPSQAVGSARSTPRSSIACAKSSRTRLPRASVEAAPSVPRPAAGLVATSPESRPPRTVTRARPRDTSKKPRSSQSRRRSRQGTHKNTPGVTPAWWLLGGFGGLGSAAYVCLSRTHIWRTLCSMPEAKTQRVHLRVAATDDELFRSAAAAANESLSEFLVESGRERAQRLLADRTRFVLSPAQWQRFTAALDRPAQEITELVELIRRSRPE